MISFQVNDMTCGHCVNSITQAVKAVDAAATLKFDLPAHRVDIDASDTGGAASAGGAHAARLRDAIQTAGYTPEPIESVVAGAAHGAIPARSGCCCR